MRDDDALRFELCSSVSGVDYLGTDERRLHAVYQLTSMTYRRRIRLEAAVTAEDPHLPSVTAVYPTADWQERETYDMFGIIFDGHPGLTRILMPDDWEGHPQRKDYPLGGIPVEYKGAEIPPPDERRSYRMTSTDSYAASRETTEGRVFTVTGGDWDSVLGGDGDPIHDERIVVNMGPQHPSTHGVLRLVLELEGETVTEARRSSATCTPASRRTSSTATGRRAPRSSPGWTTWRRSSTRPATASRSRSCSASTTRSPSARSTIRVMMMELNRIASHLVWLATTGMELGALSMMIYGFREREFILDIFEMITGLRMNMAYVRPGGVSQDVPDSAIAKIQRVPGVHAGAARRRTRTCSPAARSGPAVRRAWPCSTCRAAWRSASPARCCGRPACPWDLRKTMPYCGYEDYDFDVITSTDADVWGRYQVRLGEMRESLKIVAAGARPAAAGPGHGRGQEDRLAGAARASAPTVWATRSSTSRRSWVSRWSR